MLAKEDTKVLSKYRVVRRLRRCISRAHLHCERLVVDVVKRLLVRIRLSAERLDGDKP